MPAKHTTTATLSQVAANRTVSDIVGVVRIITVYATTIVVPGVVCISARDCEPVYGSISNVIYNHNVVCRPTFINCAGVDDCRVGNNISTAEDCIHPIKSTIE